VIDQYRYGDPAGRTTAIQTDVLFTDNHEQNQSFLTSYSYDELDRVTDTTLPTPLEGFFTTRDSTLSRVTNSVTQGRLTAVRGTLLDQPAAPVSFAPSIAYHPNGMTASVEHGNGAREVIDADASGMPRPAAIRFEGQVSCDPPVITQQPESSSVPIGTPVRLTVVATPAGGLTYAWFEGERGDTSTSVGGDAPDLDLPGVTGDVRYWVRVTNVCSVGAPNSVESEEAVLTVILSAPVDLLATTTSASSVFVTWAGSGGTYELERRSNAEGFTRIASLSGTSWSDEGLAAGVTYVYRVRSVPNGGTPSAYSGHDIATTAVFSDDPLVPGAVGIRHLHLTELRDAVSAERATAGLGPFAWTDPDLTGVPVRAVHVNELRAAQSHAHEVLGIDSGPYPGTLAPGTPIQAIHLSAIRERVK
jgi:hypothetical protein